MMADSDNRSDVDLMCQKSETLISRVAENIAPWIRSCVALRFGVELSAYQKHVVEEQVRIGSEEIVQRLRTLLAVDIAEQWSTPLALLREAFVYPTAALSAFQVAPVLRAEFEQKLYPDDVYALVPTAFADFGQSVHEAGIEWGAAKAYLHMKRNSSSCG